MKSSFEGEAIDIDEFGALIIRKDNGRIERVIAGDCHQQ
jgi:BirA family biotin operon repressor/biotin-[acetyl-CoA-carboxylase] ligase